MNEPQLRILLVMQDQADYSTVRSVPLLETVAYNEPGSALQTGAAEELDAQMLDGEWVHGGVVQQIAPANLRRPILLVVHSEAAEERLLASLEHGADGYLMGSELTSVDSVSAALVTVRREAAA